MIRKEMMRVAPEPKAADVHSKQVAMQRSTTDCYDIYKFTSLRREPFNAVLSRKSPELEVHYIGPAGTLHGARSRITQILDRCCM